MFFSLCLLLTSELLIKKNTLGSITLTQKPEVNPFYCLFVHILTSLEAKFYSKIAQQEVIKNTFWKNSGDYVL